MMKRLILTTILALGTSAWAGPQEDAKAAWARSDYAAALLIARPLAETGVSWAQLYLGFMYERGQGVPQDYAEAVTWFKLAASQGMQQSLFALGIAYRDGKGVLQDHVRAHMWFNLYSVGVRGAAKYRDDLASRMTPTQIADAQKLARECHARNFKGCE